MFHLILLFRSVGGVAKTTAPGAYGADLVCKNSRPVVSWSRWPSICGEKISSDTAKFRHRPGAKQLFDTGHAIEHRSTAALRRWITFETGDSSRIEPSAHRGQTGRGLDEKRDYILDDLVE
jgi:hypothetical protein